MWFRKRLPKALTTPLCSLTSSLSLSTSHLKHLPHRSQTAQPSTTLPKRSCTISTKKRQLSTSKGFPSVILRQSQSNIQNRANMADYEATLKGKYPAKAHARKVVEYMKSKNKDVTGVLYLEGQKTKMIEDNDGEAPFRSAFHLSQSNSI
jgi:hypothetical protein